MENEVENILHALSNDFNGEYIEEPEKAAPTPYGKFIYKNEQCTFRYKDCSLSLYSFGSSGTQHRPEGSPYKIMTSVKKDLEKQITIWPIGFFGRLISRLNSKQHELYSKYKIKGPLNFKNLISLDEGLMEKICQSKFSIYSRSSNGLVHLILIPLESVLSKKTMIRLMDVLTDITKKMEQA